MPNYVYHLVVNECRRRFLVYNCYKSCLFLPPLTVPRMKPHLLSANVLSVSSKGCGDLADEGNDGSSNSGEAQEAKRSTHGK